MLSSILLILGVAVLGMAFRSFDHPIAQRLCVLCLLGVSFLLGYLPSGNWAVGLAVATLWIFLPWLEILTKIRALRMPLERELAHKNPPGRDLFPNLDDLTEEIERQGFELVNDLGCDWDAQHQFLRLFHRPSDQTQAALCLVDQGNIAFYYISLVTRLLDGRVFTTWNYPFSYSLKFLPQTHIQRLRSTASFIAMCEAHQHLLSRNKISVDAIPKLDPPQLQALLQQDLTAQITHNVRAGLLAQVDKQQVRYTWRGMFYLWFRFLWDFV
ncbi:MAG: hypothetical protein JOZ60_08960, partial [Verrucomicrobia bacterium]|nr:hypothetical protein [Verrucomicrobiota bacterium]